MRYETDRTRLDDGSVDCLALVTEGLARIDDHRGLNAFTFVDVEGAILAAKRVDERRSSGDFRAFDGLILAVKDTISVTGLPLSCASRILGGFTAEFDATVVGRLRDLGAIIVGKTNCDEFGMGSSSEYSTHGPVRHPLDRALSAGGSSGGSAAAVAAGLCHAALGSDTGGSVRQPAAFCSVAGLRPSWGRVSRFGLTAFASSMDTIGFIAPDVSLARRLAAAVEGEDGRDAVCRAQVVPHRIRSGVQAVGVTRGGSTYHPAPIIRAALNRAVDRLAGEGLIVRDEELPGLSGGIGVYHALSSVEAASNLARFDGMRYGRRPSPARGDGADKDASFLESVSLARSQGFGAEVRRRILLGTWLSSRSDSAGRLDGARRLRARISADFEALFERVDLLVTPSTGASPFRLGAHIGNPVSLYEHDAWTIPASVAGLPAVSIPFAPADVLSEGPGAEPPGWIPGIQIIGPRHADRFVAEFAASLQDRPG